MTPAPIPPEVQDLLDRWVRAVEGKDVDALATVFRRGPELAVFWSNGERNIGWEEVRRHIEADFRDEVDLEMKMQDVRLTPMGEDAGVLTGRYEITLTVGGDSLTFTRLASMAIHREPSGWRVAALHVSSTPPSEAPPT